MEADGVHAHLVVGVEFSDEYRHEGHAWLLHENAISEQPHGIRFHFFERIAQGPARGQCCRLRFAH